MLNLYYKIAPNFHPHIIPDYSTHINETKIYPLSNLIGRRIAGLEPMVVPMTVKNIRVEDY